MRPPTVVSAVNQATGSPERRVAIRSRVIRIPIIIQMAIRSGAIKILTISLMVQRLLPSSRFLQILRALISRKPLRAQLFIAPNAEPALRTMKKSAPNAAKFCKCSTFMDSKLTLLASKHWFWLNMR